MSKKILFSVLTIILCLVLISGGWCLYTRYQKDYYSKFVYYIPSEKIKTYHFLDDDTVAVLWERDKQEGDKLINPKAIDQGQTFTSQGYIINIGARLRSIPTNLSIFSDTIFKKGLGRVPVHDNLELEKGEYWNFEVFEIKNRTISKIPKKVDIMSDINRKNPHFIPKQFISSQWSDKNYVQVIGYEKNANNFVESQLYIDMVTGKVVDTDDLTYTANSAGNMRDQLIDTVTNLGEVLENRGVILRGTSIKLSDEGKKGAKEWRIAKEEPQVLKILQQGGNLMLLKNFPKMDELANILQLFAEDGKDIFEGVTIPATASNDGQEHTVASYEEFKQYYRAE